MRKIGGACGARDVGGWQYHTGVERERGEGVVIRTGHGPPPICHWEGGRGELGLASTAIISAINHHRHPPSTTTNLPTEGFYFDFSGDNRAR